MLKSLSLQNFLPGFLPAKKVAKFQVGKKSESVYRFYFSVGLIALNVILLASYIYGVNNYASKGYEIRTLQAKVADLNTEIKTWNLQVAKASSMVSIQNDFTQANFVPAGTPKFLLINKQYSFNK